jgi:hypothetical protein
MTAHVEREGEYDERHGNAQTDRQQAGPAAVPRAPGSGEPPRSAESHPMHLRWGRGQLLMDAAEKTPPRLDVIGLCRERAANFVDDLLVTQHNVGPSD